MKKILLVFGTRPEAIKMCPLVHALKNEPSFRTVVCVTGQHKQMLEQVLSVFRVTADHDLKIMREQQTLFDITAAVVGGIRDILEREQPDLVLVHGDTTSAYGAALAAFYQKIPVGHVEAGLRTYDMHAPFPEEFNRQSIDLISDFLFAPTETAKAQLLREGKHPARIFVTGNTVIDALRFTTALPHPAPFAEWLGDSRSILLTAHRRENLGDPLRSCFRGILRVLEENADVKLIYPVHLNSAVRCVANEVLGDHPRILLTEPLDVVAFHHLMANSHLILTDSGGIQEEASALGKPVLVLRDTTERPEGIAAGNLELVGTEEENVYRAFTALLRNEALHRSMSQAEHPYGDGAAALRITEILKNSL